MAILYDLLLYMGVLLAAGCAAATLATWALLPRWRSLQNYISFMQIILNALQVCVIPLTVYHELEMYTSILIGELLELSLFWSLCASILAYMKLVLLHNGKISGEKRYVTLFCFGTVALINIYSRIIATNVFGLILDHTVYIDMSIIFILMILNLSIFMKIVCSMLCCRNTEFFRKKVRRVVSVICVRLICDSSILIVFLYYCVMSDGNLPEELYLLGLYLVRLAPQTVFVLCRKSTRNMWTVYLQKRRNRCADRC